MHSCPIRCYGSQRSVVRLRLVDGNPEGMPPGYFSSTVLTFNSDYRRPLVRAVVDKAVLEDNDGVDGKIHPVLRLQCIEERWPGKELLQLGSSTSPLHPPLQHSPALQRSSWSQPPQPLFRSHIRSPVQSKLQLLSQHAAQAAPCLVLCGSLSGQLSGCRAATAWLYSLHMLSCS